MAWGAKNLAKKITFKALIRQTGLNGEELLRGIRAKQLPAWYDKDRMDWIIKEKDFENWKLAQKK